MSRKKLHRIYREEKLIMRWRGRRKRAIGTRAPQEVRSDGVQLHEKVWARPMTTLAEEISDDSDTIASRCCLFDPDRGEREFRRWDASRCLARW